MPPQVIVDDFFSGNTSGTYVSRVLTGDDVSESDVAGRGDFFQPILEKYGGLWLFIEHTASLSTGFFLLLATVVLGSHK